MHAAFEACYTTTVPCGFASCEVHYGAEIKPTVEWRTLGEKGDSAGWPTRAHAEGWAAHRLRLYGQKYVVQHREITPWKEA